MDTGLLRSCFTLRDIWLLFNEWFIALSEGNTFFLQFKLMYKLISHCDGSVNIQGYIFVSAMFLSSVYLRQFSLGLPINSYVPLSVSPDSYFLLTAIGALSVNETRIAKHLFVADPHSSNSGFCHCLPVDIFTRFTKGSVTKTQFTYSLSTTSVSSVPSACIFMKVTE